MAKFWEVIKAFQEGTAVKAVRSLNGRIKAVKEESGVVFYNSKDEPYQVQSIGDDDLTLDWEIIEKMDRKKFKYVFGVFLLSSKKLSLDKRPERETHESESDTSLSKLFELISSRYPMDNVKVISAVGVTHEGETIILVQEGEAVE